MPYKKGPNGTKRYYSAENGRYCSDPMFQNNWQLSKKTSYQSERERREIIFNLAQKSTDKYLFDIYQELERINPGTTTHVNFTYTEGRTGKKRELDIITKKAIYEIKSGKRGRSVKQFTSQKLLAKKIGKDHVVFSPKITDYQVKCLRRMDFKVYNKLEEFIEEEEKRK